MSSLPLLCLWSIACVSCILWLISTDKWVHTMHVLLRLGYHTQDNNFNIHPLACKIIDAFTFNRWLVFCCLGVTHLLHPHFIWRTPRLFQFLVITKKAVMNIVLKDPQHEDLPPPPCSDSGEATPQITYEKWSWCNLQEDFYSKSSLRPTVVHHGGVEDHGPQVAGRGVI